MEKETYINIVDRFIAQHENDNINDWCPEVPAHKKHEHIFYEYMMAHARPCENSNGTLYIEIPGVHSKERHAVIFEFEEV